MTHYGVCPDGWTFEGTYDWGALGKVDRFCWDKRAHIHVSHGLAGVPYWHVSVRPLCDKSPGPALPEPECRKLAGAFMALVGESAKHHFTTPLSHQYLSGLDLSALAERGQ